MRKSSTNEWAKADYVGLRRDVGELWRLLLQAVVVFTVAVVAIAFLALAALIMASG